MRQLIDALDDGIALADQDGTIVLANRRLADMLGYQPGELAGQPVEALVPVGLREAHLRHRAGYARRPAARPMADRARLVAVRHDGGTVPVTITLAPVPTAGGHLVLAVVRDAAHAQQGTTSRPSSAPPLLREAERSRELLDRRREPVPRRTVPAGCRRPADGRSPRADQRGAPTVDDSVHQIRDHVFRSRPPGSPL